MVVAPPRPATKPPAPLKELCELLSLALVQGLCDLLDGLDERHPSLGEKTVVTRERLIERLVVDETARYGLGEIGSRSFCFFANDAPVGAQLFERAHDCFLLAGRRGHTFEDRTEPHARAAAHAAAATRVVRAAPCVSERAIPASAKYFDQPDQANRTDDEPEHCILLRRKERRLAQIDAHEMRKRAFGRGEET
jgi:hypothetical protein